MRSSMLYTIVSISGASVLAIEMLGTRILGPFYGVSLFLWSALIAVTLAALALGYAVGGRWADRGPRVSRLGLLLVLAGAWLLLVPWIERPVLRLTEPLGLRAAVLLAACVLFAPPLTLLGMVSPYAVRLQAPSLERVGRTAGNLYAVSTVASVVAALLTGFFLIPNVGVDRLVLLVGLLLLGAGGLTLAGSQRSRAGAGVAALLVGLAIVGLSKLPAGAAPAEGLVTLEQSAYAQIGVVDSDDARLLVIDGAIHTMVMRNTWEPLHRYAAGLGVCKFLFESPGRLLVVGLGGGAIVKSYAKDGWQIDAVEIDPAVTRIARQYFGLEDSEARVFDMDGRRFLSTRDETWDLIVLDAYGSSSIPFHLVTREVFGLVSRRLEPGGVLAINVEAQGWDDILVRALTVTLEEHFSTVLALPLAEPPNALGNLLVLAANRDLEFAPEKLPHPKDFLPFPTEHFAVLQMNHAWDNRFHPETQGVPVLTDDLNPVDIWAERINLAARMSLHPYWSQRGFEW